MAWTDPRTWVTAEVVTAALFNTHLRDNLNALERRVGGSVLGNATSTAAGAEQISGTQAFTVVSGSIYRVTLSTILSAAAATPSVASVRLRQSTGAVTTASTQIGQDGKVYLAATGGSGNTTLTWVGEFTAASSGTLNIAVGVAGSGATTYTAVAPLVVLDKVS